MLKLKVENSTRIGVALAQRKGACKGHTENVVKSIVCSKYTVEQAIRSSTTLPM